MIIKNCEFIKQIIENNKQMNNQKSKNIFHLNEKYVELHANKFTSFLSDFHIIYTYHITYIKSLISFKMFNPLLVLMSLLRKIPNNSTNLSSMLACFRAIQ